jgi:hypothetical protein
MRIYEGSPRQEWEEVLHTVGAFADGERIKEILFLELDAGFILQGLAQPQTSAWAEGSGSLSKQTFELVEDQISELLDKQAAARTSSDAQVPQADIGHYYEQALRVLGAYVDTQKARDLFFFEQDGSFVLRLLVTDASGAVGHSLAEFTRDEIMGMIEVAPQQRGTASETPGA